MFSRNEIVVSVRIGCRVQRKSSGSREDDGKQIGNCAVKIAALECRIPFHRTLKRNEFHLDAFFGKISALCCNDKRDGVGIRHQPDGQF